MSSNKLSQAIISGDLLKTKELLEKGIDPNTIDSKMHLSPLMLSAIYTKKGVLIFEELLKAGADPYYRLGNRSLLTYVLSNLNCCLPLLEILHNEDVHFFEEDLKLNLGQIIFHPDEKVLKFFLDHGHLDPNKKFPNGKTLLDIQNSLNPLKSHLDLLESRMK